MRPWLLDFPWIPDILRITVCYSASRTSPLVTYIGHTCNKQTTVNKEQIISQWQFVIVNIYNVKWPFKPFKVTYFGVSGKATRD